MVAYDPLAFGRSLHAQRMKLGWSASQLVGLYAEFIGREDSPPDPTFIYHLEGGKTVLGIERRAILASLVGIPVMGMAQQDSPTHIDIPEYTQALEVYCDQIYRRHGTLKQEIEAIDARTNHLETAVLQAFDAEKRRLLELFGFYQILLAEALRGQQSAIAHALLTSCISTAKEGKFSALHVHALTLRAGLAIGRFEFTLNREVLQVAMRDTDSAVEEQDNLPALYAGLLHVRRGLLDAYTARNKQAFTAALHVIAKGSNHIGATSDDKRIIARLDEEYCMLIRASAYLYSPMGDAKLGLAQLQELELEYPEARGRSRLVHRHQLLALAFLATRDYPMAAAHLEAAVENASEDGIASLVQIHARLKDTSYGNDPDIGRIAVKIHRMMHPEIFLQRFL